MPLSPNIWIIEGSKKFPPTEYSICKDASPDVLFWKGNVATTKRFALPRCPDVWHCTYPSYLRLSFSTFPSEAKYFSKMPEIINSYQYAGLPAAKSNKNPNFVNLSQQHQQNHIATKTYYLQYLQNSSIRLVMILSKIWLHLIYERFKLPSSILGEADAKLASKPHLLDI